MNYQRIFPLIALLCLVCICSCKQTPQATVASSLPDLKERSSALAGKDFETVKKKYAALRAQLAINPDDPKALLGVAQLFVGEAKVTGDHHYYYPGAEKLMDRVLEIDKNDLGALLMKGTVMLTFHRFKDALDIGQKARGLSSTVGATYGILTDANLELGNYDEAVRMCDKMNAIRPDLSSYSRASYLRELHGDHAGACEAMKLAADAGAGGQEDRAWALYQLGNLYLNQGKPDTAEFIYKGILDERPVYARAMLGLADVAAGRRKYAQAIDLLIKASQLVPEHIYIERLADMYLLMGDTANSRTMEKKVLDAFDQHARDGWRVDREYAVFCLSHNINLAESLRRAKAEYDTRPKNIDALDTYAYALYKNGRSAEAVPLIEQALRLNTRNPAMHYRASLIYEAAGRKDKAAAMLALAMKENPYLVKM